jgi:hypothetical protein
MAEIQNINNKMDVVISLKTNIRSVQTVDTKITKNDSLIDVKEKHINTLENHIKLTEENRNLRKEYIQTLQESINLNTKGINLYEQIIEVTENRRLIKHRSINTNNITPLEINSLKKQLDNLGERKSVLKEQISIIDLKNNKLTIKAEYIKNEIIKFEGKINIIVNNSISRKKLDIDSSVIGVTILSNKKDTSRLSLSYNPTSIQIRHKDWHREQKDWDDQRINTATIRKEKLEDKVANIISNPPAEGYKAELHIMRIERMIDYLEDRMWSSRSILRYHTSSEEQKSKYVEIIENDTIQLNNLKEFLTKYNVEKPPINLNASNSNIQNADLLLKTTKYNEALIIYDEIIEKNPDISKIKVDDKYRPLDEQLRLVSKEYMNLQKLQIRLNLNFLSNQNLVVSYITAHVHGKYSVNKSEVINMINNQFYYPSIDNT